VRAAVHRGAIDVLMRKGRRKWWLNKVNELKGYDGLVILKNPRNPTISPRGCHDGDFEKVVTAIEAAKKKTQ
jgi:hypothetical protein